jgi:hypothetical protein
MPDAPAQLPSPSFIPQPLTACTALDWEVVGYLRHFCVSPFPGRRRQDNDPTQLGHGFYGLSFDPKIARKRLPPCLHADAELSRLCTIPQFAPRFRKGSD